MNINEVFRTIKTVTGKKIILILAILLAVIGLKTILPYNPHQNLQAAIMESAAKVHSYYRDRPGYWQLSTNTAKEDGLIAPELLRFAEYEVQIGQGLNGESSLPSDYSFNIVLKHLNKSACINLSEAEIDAEAKLILQQITLINLKQNITYTWGGNNLLPIAKYSMRKICDAAENTLVWNFQ
ncbi:MAG: hypothetical protein IJ099_04360 [Alphaproteobacteria bacterium]|nr:hypothetical protein [Alphaproteobacteria bacterium]